jgi:branched-chain amino acid transport system permease protein
MRVINLAQGELVLLAAYIAYSVESGLGLNPVLAIPIALVVVCLTSAIVYFVVSRIKKDREINSLILTYGIGVILTNGMLLIWKADIRSTSSEWLQEAFVLGPFYSMRSEVLFFGVSLLMMAALVVALAQLVWRAVRAVSSNRDAAKLMGINPGYTELVSFIVAGILASFAGVALFSYGVISPAYGGVLTVKAFIITVLAGVGSIPGVLIGAILLGVAEALTVTLASSALQELAGMGCSCWCCSSCPTACSACVREGDEIMTMNKNKLPALLLPLLLIGAPLLLAQDHYVMSLLVASMVIGGIALSWALLGNLGGMISFGHAAFFGVGAYTSAVLSMKFGVPVLLGLLLGGVGALIAAWRCCRYCACAVRISRWRSWPTPTSSASWPRNGVR